MNDTRIRWLIAGLVLLASFTVFRAYPPLLVAALVIGSVATLLAPARQGNMSSETHSLTSRIIGVIGLALAGALSLGMVGLISRRIMVHSCQVLLVLILVVAWLRVFQVHGTQSR